jgi:protein-S-isoprenylcysteine O-methyltransferase Ste14
MSDMERVTEGRCDKELTRILVDDAADTTLRIDKSVSSLVQAGPFRYSRNPGYLSLTMLYAGTAILRNALWAILLLPLVLCVIQREVIEREERYLERIFGEEYLAYKRRVRRWV